MAEEDKKGKMAVVTHHVATVPVTDISTQTMLDLQKMRGVETSVEENPGEEPKVVVKVNTLELPNKK